MDGTFTVSSQSDRSPLSAPVLCLFFFTVLFLPCSHFSCKRWGRDFQKCYYILLLSIQMRSVIQKVISKEFVKVLHDIKVVWF